MVVRIDIIVPFFYFLQRSVCVPGTVFRHILNAQIFWAVRGLKGSSRLPSADDAFDFIANWVRYSRSSVTFVGVC